MSLSLFAGILGMIFITCSALFSFIASGLTTTNELVKQSIPHYDIHKGTLYSLVNQKVLSNLLVFYLILGTSIQSFALVLSSVDSSIHVENPWIVLVTICLISVVSLIVIWKSGVNRKYDKSLAFYHLGHYYSTGHDSAKKEHLKGLRELLKDNDLSDEDVLVIAEKKFKLTKLL